MATFNVSIGNTIAVFGGKKTSNWGTMLWGEKWAFGTLGLIKTVGKSIDNSQPVTGSVSTLLTIYKTINETLTVTGDMYSEERIDSHNWKTVWGSSENAESRPFTSYNTANAGSVSFTTAVNSSTSWTML